MKEIKITQIDGIKIGNAQDEKGATGCTVILCEEGGVAGVDVRGGSPASRETELLNPINTVEEIHAVMLSGGSAYGLDAAAGVMEFLEERGKGFDVSVGVVPIVCGASLFDLIVGNPKSRPDKKMGYEACQDALLRSCQGQEPLEGNVGAGTGAAVGKFYGPERMMKSGLGVYAMQVGELQVGAVVAVNALGDVVDVDLGGRIAGLLDEKKSSIISTDEAIFKQYDDKRNLFQGNTTIGCVVTNAKLTKAQASKVASIAQNGLARAIRPVHTSVDGDTVFVISTGVQDVMIDAVGSLSVEVMSRAINQAVRKAKSAYGLKTLMDLRRL